MLLRPAAFGGGGRGWASMVDIVKMLLSRDQWRNPIANYAERNLLLSIFANSQHMRGWTGR